MKFQMPAAKRAPGGAFNAAEVVEAMRMLAGRDVPEVPDADCRVFRLPAGDTGTVWVERWGDRKFMAELGIPAKYDGAAFWVCASLGNICD